MPVLETLLERRASSTTPSGLASPATWLVDFLGGGSQSASGKRVTPETALTVSTVWACIRFIAETIATLPLPLYAFTADGGRRRAPEHPLYYLLHDQPNEWQTSVEFQEMKFAHLCLRGNFFAEVIEDRRGRIEQLVPLHPDRVHVYQAPDRSIWYEHFPLTGTRRVFRTGEIHHTRGMTLDGVVGLAPVSLARESIGLAMAAEEHGARFFSNSALPRGVLRHPKNLSDKAAARLRASWDARHAGLQGSSRTAILEEGMEWQQMQFTNADSQFLESRQFQIAEICRWFRVPPHLVQDLTRSTNNNIEHQGLEVVRYTLRPYLVRDEKAIKRDLFSESERRTHFAEYNAEALLRGDQKSRYESYAIGRQWGWVSPNDVRTRENENRIPGGDTYLQPLNMVPLGSDPFSDPAPAPNDDPDAVPPAGGRARRGAARSLVVRQRLTRAARPVFQDAVARTVRREVEAARRALKRATDAADAAGVVATVSSWQREFLAEHTGYVARALFPVVRMLVEQLAGEAAWEIQAAPETVPDLDGLALAFAEGLAAREEGASRQLLGAARGTTAAEALDALEVQLRAWEERRPTAAAQRETVQLGGAVARAVFRAAGVPAVRVAAGTCPDTCLCRALDGRTVAIGAPVLAAGDVVELPDGSTYTSDRAVHHPPFAEGCSAGLTAAYPTR